MPRKKSSATPVPHSWGIENWPPGVYPGAPGKGRYLVRSHRDSLVAAGTLTRVGKDLVVFGEPFAAWLQQQADRVQGYEIAPNRAAHTQVGQAA